MVSVQEVVLWLIPTAVSIFILIAVLVFLATRRTDTAEYRRLADRVRHLEANHSADLVQITSFREEIFYLGRLISMLATVIEDAGLIIPGEVDRYLQRRRVGKPIPGDPDLAILIQHALDQFFSLEELELLSFELGIDFDNLPGTTKERKAQEIVLFVDRRSQLEMLVQAVHEMRPNVPLPWLGGRDPP